jgi:5-hydroxyisourate hydrolase-like protein (transthyretin family)
MKQAEMYNTRAVRAAWVIVGLGALAFVFSFVAGAEETALPSLGLHVVAAKSFLSDSPAALRVIATDHARHQPASGATVTVRLAAANGKQGAQLVRGKTDALGTLDARFRIPALEPGTYSMHVEATYGRARDSLDQDIQVRKAYQLMLVTDKPLYQPNQTIHMRALVLRRPDLKPAVGETLFEVRDSKGNKVFKRQVKTNDLGAAWADFVLADEINMGNYECKATFGDAEATKTLTVKRYVLPKFKVSATTDRDFYLPGGKLSGTASAQYFFGKSVDGAKVHITAKTFDVSYTKIAEVSGDTSADGTFPFSIDLPTHFVGQPLEQGNAFVELEIKVTDKADHTEKIVVTKPVAAQELQIHAVPESGKLVPNVPNNIWVLVSEPTGTPVKAQIRLDNITADKPWTVDWAKTTIDTDDLGIAQVTLTPKSAAALGTVGDEEGPGMPGGFVGGIAPPPAPMGKPRRGAPVEPGAQPTGPIHLGLLARARDGRLASTKADLPIGASVDNESLLLRADKGIARVGQSVRVTALSPVESGYVYFDVIKDRQTMLTRAADMRGGRASTDLSLGPELAGTVYISAYRITRGGNTVRDTRALLVEPAGALKIQVRPGQEVYRPGEPAQVDFDVRTASGQPAVAALGVSIVDESVFALQDMQPGMERVYAYLEEELRKPRYEIHGLELPTIIARPLPVFDTRRQRAAQFMLASIDVPDPDLLVKDTYVDRLTKAKADWATKMEPKLILVQRALGNYQRDKRELPTAKQGIKPLLDDGYLKPDDITDLWGHTMKVQPAFPGQDRLYQVLLLSAGPDGEFGSEDDVLVAGRRAGGMRRGWFGAVRGAGGRLMIEGDMAAPGAPMPMAAMAPQEEKAGMAGGAAKPEAGAKPVRVREFFPETLLFRPDLITNDQGHASLQFNMADSITTWRLTALANSAKGDLGSTDAPMRCFQDFFVDIDLPVALTQGDECSIPVAVYNYLKDRQTVRLKIEQQDWFELSGDPEQSLDLGPNEVTSRRFHIKAVKLGDHKLTVFAYGTKLSDAIKRDIRVEPDGKMIVDARNGRLAEASSVSINIPGKAIDGASHIMVKIYPGVFSQVVDGLDGLLQMPFGCFEQTTSVTYPNILVLDYMRATKQVTPEAQMKAEGFINFGYQRLVAYEVQGGGFSWFGDAPANRMLTAMGIMEFHDMAQVFPIDENLIPRTQNWLLGQQNGDGSWDADKAYLHQESWGRLQNAKLLPTAYITWALASTGEKSDRTRKAYDYVRGHAREAGDPYQLAVLANSLVAGDNTFNKGDLDDATIAVFDKLIGMAKKEGEKMWWESKMTGFTHSSGEGADLEATGLAAIALINSGRYGAEATQVLNYLVAKKQAGGTWGSTQATILALKAMLLAQKGATQKAAGAVDITVNGKPAGSFDITPENADVVRMADVRDGLKDGQNDVKIIFKGQGSMLYQVSSKYYLPWSVVEKPSQRLLDVGVSYDKTKLAVDDTATARVHVKNNAPGQTSMIVIDLGIPPGFTVEAGDLAELVGQKTISKFNLTGRQVIVYLEQLDAGQEVRFEYRVKARFPVKAKTPATTAYEYYNPDNRAEAQPAEIVINE